MGERDEFICWGQVAGVGAAVEPEDPTAGGDQRGAWKLEDVAVLLEGAGEADPAARLFGFGPAPAQVAGGEDDLFPGAPPEAHGPVALFGGVGDADLGDTVPSAEAGSLLGGALHNAGQADTTRLELGELLAQLREYLDVELSAEVTQPQDQGRPVGPQIGESPGLALGRGVDKIRRRASDRYGSCHF